jgi:hypothetical protein
MNPYRVELVIWDGVGYGLVQIFGTNATYEDPLTVQWLGLL